MYYKIVKITDRKGVDKLDETAKSRIGRVIDMRNSFIMQNRSALLVCVNWQKSMVTSPVEEWIENPGEIVIKTQNSVYTLREE